MSTEARLDTLLLVEDSPDDVVLTRRALRKAGLDVPVHICTNGEEGVEHLASHPPPSLVLLDWKLPRRNGAEVLSWIRGRAELAQLPVIVVSSSRLQEDIDVAFARGANAFLEKPLQASALLAELERLGLRGLLT